MVKTEGNTPVSSSRLVASLSSSKEFVPQGDYALRQDSGHRSYPGIRDVEGVLPSVDNRNDPGEYADLGSRQNLNPLYKTELCRSFESLDNAATGTSVNLRIV
jgi:hypothetical protein